MEREILAVRLKAGRIHGAPVARSLTWRPNQTEVGRNKCVERV